MDPWSHCAKLLCLSALAWCLGAGSAHPQIFGELSDFVIQYPVGDPKAAARHSAEGPKGIATADFDGDDQADLAVSNSDGTVTIWYGLGTGRFDEEQQPRHLRTGGADLRGIVCADFNADTRPDLAAVSPYDGYVYLFMNLGGRRFAPVIRLPAWMGARNLAAGDFDGDGRQDLAVAGTTNGVRQYKGLGDGTFAEVTNLVALGSPFKPRSFPKPVFTLQTVRAADGSRDELIVTHAHTNRVWVLAELDGRLTIKSSTLNNEAAQNFAVGNLLTTNGWPDLVNVDTDKGTVVVHPGSANGFSNRVHQVLHIDGGPRAVRLADLDADGWNDLIVVVRNLDRVLTYRNTNGVLAFANERPVGLSPRDLIVADLDQDAYPDTVVINRISQDVTVLLSAPGQVGFSAVDHMYLVDGNVVGLSVKDFNEDGYDDVIQLHRASGDFSVRLARPDGTLQEPIFYTIGKIPASQVITDVNNDDAPDQVTANLGITGIERGSVSVRLGQGDGTFGEEKRFFLPAENEGRLYGLVPGDFDGDGDIDLAAGYLDGRIAFFENQNNGEFRFTREHLLCKLAQEIVVGDFDQDPKKDLDLAVVDITGTLFIIENRGDLLETTTLVVDTYPAPIEDGLGVCSLKTVDLNHDGDLDLVVGSSQRALLYLGGPGTSFLLQSTNLGGIDFDFPGVVQADFQGDGWLEMVIANRQRNRITVLTQQPGDPTGTNWTVLAVSDVPACKFLATGDLDGDGLPDLVGTGNMLWTVLSQHPAQRAAPLQTQGSRAVLRANPQVNEILALNVSLPVEADGDRTSAWAEIFNGTGRSFSLAGWRLRLTDPKNTLTNEFTFPAGAFFTNGAHRLVIFSESRRSLYHSGFALPPAGATLALLNHDGLEVDRLAYPAQVEDVSYARYHDGLPSLVFNPFPSPGRRNTDNGVPAPDFELDEIDPATFRPGQAIRFVGASRNGAEVLAASLVFQRLDVPEQPAQELPLYDDGQHADALPGDQRFGGHLVGGLPAGAQFQYLLVVEDLDKNVFTIPEDPLFARPGQPGNLAALALPLDLPQLPLEISEVMAFNLTGLTDEVGGTPDWIEIRNYSAAPVNLRGVSLARQLTSGNPFTFSTDRILGPREHLVLFCDANPGQGPLHTTFNLNRAGDQVVLCALTTNGVPTLVDYVRFGPLGADRSLARLGRGGAWHVAPPTPFQPNGPGCFLAPQTNGAARIIFAFPTLPDRAYTLEYAPTLGAPAWQALPPILGDGLEAVTTWPLDPSGFFRVRLNP